MHADRTPGDRGLNRAPSSPLHPMEWAAQSGATGEVMRKLERRLRRRRRRRWQAVAAGFTAVLIAAAAWQKQPATTGATVVSPSPSMVVNAPAQRVLPDGSIVDLKPGASIRVEFSVPIRRVVLERGAAHFQVAKNATRPFVVLAGNVEARAVGTAFSVELTSATTEVVVTEGQVAVGRTAVLPTTPGAATRLPPPVGTTPSIQTLAMLVAGHRTVVQTGEGDLVSRPEIERLSPRELGERLEWRVPTLEFSATPLEDAIPMVNRHGKVRLVLADRSIGKVRLSGVIRADNTDTLLRLLQEEHGIAAERRPGGEIALSRAH